MHLLEVLVGVRVPLESIVCYFHTFDNNLGIKQKFTKHSNIFLKMLFSVKYFQNCQACFGRPECEWVNTNLRLAISLCGNMAVFMMCSLIHLLWVDFSTCLVIFYLLGGVTRAAVDKTLETSNNCAAIYSSVGQLNLLKIWFSSGIYSNAASKPGFLYLCAHNWKYCQLSLKTVWEN